MHARSISSCIATSVLFPYVFDIIFVVGVFVLVEAHLMKKAQLRLKPEFHEERFFLLTRDCHYFYTGVSLSLYPGLPSLSQCSD